MLVSNFADFQALVSSLKLPELSRLDFTMMYHDSSLHNPGHANIYEHNIDLPADFLVQFVALSVANYSME